MVSISPCLNNEKKMYIFFVTRRKHVSCFQYGLFNFVLRYAWQKSPVLIVFADFYYLAAILIIDFYRFRLRKYFLKSESENKNMFTKISSKGFLQN